MSLHEINQGIHKHKRPNRKGRGLGSGQGKTAGRGHKGQFARSGWKGLSIFQGGGSPLVRRGPKRGVTNAGALLRGAINIGDPGEVVEAGAATTPGRVATAGSLKKRLYALKIL